MKLFTSLFLSSVIGFTSIQFALADTLPEQTPSAATPLIAPTPPQINAKSYILIDVNSGLVLAEYNADDPMPPASLTKIMTVYLASEALENGNINMDDEVLVSKKAWRTGGSRMFIQEGTKVSTQNLIKGVVVQSGNDASVALAEHIAGSEDAFADLMNQQARALGMQASNFMNSTGLPDSEMYTTARDMAILGRATILDHPDDYKWYSEKSFTYNDIRQHNRNRLLWRNPDVDGLKTGHTNEAGYCLVSSAKRDDMRVLAVVMNAPSGEARVSDSQRLLTYGFRFFDSDKLYAENQPIEMLRVWKGENKTVPVGVADDIYITYPTGQYQNLVIDMEVDKNLQAPINKGDIVGHLAITLAGDEIINRPIVALATIERGGFFSRMKDNFSMRFQQWLDK